LSRLNNFICDISLDTTAEVQKEFGGILLFETDTDKEYTTYADLKALEVDFANTTESYKIAQRIFGQTPSPSSLSVIGDATATPADITAKLDSVINKSWFGLVCTDNANATITALATWADANDRVYSATTQDLTIFATETAANLRLIYHNSADSYVAEGELANMLTAPIGSKTPKFRKVAGAPGATITDVQLASLHAAHGSTYIEDMGELQITNSQTQSGEHFDVILGKYWIKYTMEQEMLDLAIKTDKIPYSDKGIAMLIGVCTNVLNKAEQNGIVLVDDDGKPVFSYAYKTRAEVAQADRANRKYNGISWTATLAGAIESATISGVLSL